MPPVLWRALAMPHCQRQVVSTVGAGFNGRRPGIRPADEPEQRTHAADGDSGVCTGSEPAGVGVRDRAELAAMMAKLNSARWV